MNLNKKKNITINTLFIIYLLISTIFYMYSNAINNNSLIDEIKGLSNFQIVIGVLGYFVICFIATCIQNIYIVIIFLAIKFGIKKNKKNKLDNIDFNKYKGYYRDIINEYSPSLLSYIDNYEVGENKDICASLIDLKLKNYIDIKDSKIIKLDMPQNNLEENQKYILDSKLENYDANKFKKLVIEDALKKELIESRYDFKDKMTKKTISAVVIAVLMIINLYIFPPMLLNSDNMILNIVGVVLIIIAISIALFYPLYTFVYIRAYSISNINDPYIRTKKGNEINRQLEGLKNYIKDFGSMEEKSLEELKLWEDYLVYSVLFNQNQKIADEFSIYKFE